jgi:hypothetical protein
MMIRKIQFERLMSGPHRQSGSKVGVLALLTLGIVEMLERGTLSSQDAARLFFHAENCLYVRRRLRDKAADDIMAHGVQLADLFQALSDREARQEFRQELETLRSLCLRLLGQRRGAA